jgi:hypothetical protein
MLDRFGIGQVIYTRPLRKNKGSEEVISATFYSGTTMLPSPLLDLLQLE